MLFRWCILDFLNCYSLLIKSGISHFDEMLTECEIFTLNRDLWNCTNIYFDPLEKDHIQNLLPTLCLFLSSIFITIFNRWAPPHTKGLLFFSEIFLTYPIFFKKLTLQWIIFNVDCHNERIWCYINTYLYKTILTCLPTLEILMLDVILVPLILLRKNSKSFVVYKLQWISLSTCTS